MDARDIILKPVVTEASTSILGDNKYTFDVAKHVNKTQVKQAIQEIFAVKVSKVNILNQKGKKKRRGRYIGYTPMRRKAIVTLTKDSKSIPLFGHDKKEKKGVLNGLKKI